MTQQQAQAAFAAHITTLAATIDQLNYYQLLNVPLGATADQIKSGYHQVAKIYHPDSHRQASPQVRQCLHTVFKRMTEAYRVLYDFGRRKQYDAHLQKGGPARMAENKREQKGPRSPDADLKTLTGKRCFMAALQAIKRKDYMNAKLQLQLALTHEGMTSKPVKDKIAELEQLMRGGK